MHACKEKSHFKTCAKPVITTRDFLSLLLGELSCSCCPIEVVSLVALRGERGTPEDGYHGGRPLTHPHDRVAGSC